jgi:hypothetical protein
MNAVKALIENRPTTLKRRLDHLKNPWDEK